MKKASKYIASLLTVAILGVFVWYLLANKSSFQELLDISLWAGLSLLALNVLRLYNNGSFLKYSLEFRQKNIGHAESFYVAVLTAIGNFFGPFMGGAGVRALYLKKKHDLSYTDFASTLSGFYFITFIIHSAIGLAALFVIHLQTGVFSYVMYLVFAGWLLASVLLAEVRNINRLFFNAEKRIPKLKNIVRLINNAISGWHLIKNDKKLFFRLNRISFYGFAILFLITYVEFRAIGVAPSFAAVSLYVAISALSLLVSITPNAIGIKEGMFIFTSSLIGLNTKQILAIAVIDRASTFIVLFVGYLAIKTSKMYKTLNGAHKPS